MTNPLPNPLDVSHACRAYTENAFEAAFQKHPGDPYRAIAWLLHQQTSMPNRRAEYFLRQLEPLRTGEPETTTPKPAAALREVLGVLLSRLACLSPTYYDALKLADEHNLTARDLLTFMREIARKT